jgi:hypothetical protein
MRANGRRYVRQFETADAEAEAEADPSVADTTLASEEPGYAFEGFSVEFLDKVALMPVTGTSVSPRRAR